MSIRRAKARRARGPPEEEGRVGDGHLLARREVARVDGAGQPAALLVGLARGLRPTRASVGLRVSYQRASYQSMAVSITDRSIADLSFQPDAAAAAAAFGLTNITKLSIYYILFTSN